MKLARTHRLSGYSLALVIAAGAGCSAGSATEAARSSQGVGVAQGVAVRIVSVASGKVLDLAGSSDANGAHVQQWGFGGGKNQQWLVHEGAGGGYTIASVATTKCLDLSGASSDDGASIQQWSCAGQDNQRWNLRAASDGDYEIVSARSGKCVDLAGASGDDGAAIQQWNCVGSANQRWRFEPIETSAATLDSALVGVEVEIVSALTGKALDVAGASREDGALVQQWGDWHGANQQWTFKRTDGGGFTIASALSGKCLDVAGASDADGARLQQWNCSGGRNQEWNVRSLGGDRYALASAASSKCVDLAGGSDADGAAVNQWSCWDGPNQVWLVRPVASTSGKPTTPGTPTPPASLRDAADRAGKWIGVALSPSHFGDAQYGATAAREFNYVTPENELKWDATEPSRGHFDFAGGDAVVDFAASHGMHVKGHTLVWHNQLPGWVDALNDASSVRAAMTDHITALASRYRGKVAAWDVVNEAIDDSPSHPIRNDVFRRTLGEGYIAEAFRIAHSVDPDALLFYNDYGVEGLDGKSDAMYALVKGLVESGVPISGVGLQTHVGATDGPSAAAIAANMHRLAALGLLVNVSELDVGVCAVIGSTDAKLAAQQKRVHDVIAACMSEPRCPSVTVWGVSDKDSWLNSFAPCGSGQTGKPWGLAFDDGYGRKPAWNGIVEAFQGR